MSLINNNCIDFIDKRKECKAEEHGKKYLLINTSEYLVRKVKVDGCLDQKHGEQRCDYLISIDNQYNNLVFFIELKGGDLIKAVKQVLSTINYLHTEFKSYQIESRIIGTRNVPQIKNTPEYKRLVAFVKPKGSIKIATNKFYSESI